MQAITSSEANWYIRIPVQNTSATNEKLQLGFNHEHVTKLMKMLQPSFDVKTAKENDILKAILTNPEKSFSLTYDTIDYKVTDLDLK